MDITGIWRVSQLCRSGGGSGPYWVSADDLITSGDPVYADIARSKILFDNDGFAKSIMKIPREVTRDQISQALETGELELFGEDMMVVDKHNWKSENGKYYYDSGISGWVEITYENGMIELLSNRWIRE